MAAALETYFAPAWRVADEAVQRLHEELLKESLLVEMLEAFPSPVAVINRERQIVLYNKRFAEAAPLGADDRMLGLRLGESVGCEASAEAPSGCGTGKACRLCGAVVAMLHAQGGTPSLQECRITAQDGEQSTALDFRVMAAPITVRGHEVTIVSVADISDEKRRSVLERMFFHDVLNTAGGVKSIADLFRLVEPDTHEELIDDLGSLSEQLVEEIRMQRDLLAAERGDLLVTLQPLAPGDIVRHVVALYRFHRVAQGKDIAERIADGLPLWNSEPVLLARVLGNLVKNALEASVDGDVVTVSCEQDGDVLCFAVHNPAVIPEHIALQLFKRSFSTKGSGRGIGTYSARLLTEKYLGGSISMRSEAGSGTVFQLRFPLA
ncbi:MAG TPA: HAMP domain-containing sensor histidine kinase [Bacteroidota bacterium]|nr:HAMP domain-containing sensor histidine kinase [Bacteroidota bacterium]